MLGNDTDVDGGPKTITQVTQPANGTVAITGGGAGLTYTPDAELLQRRQPDRHFTYTLNGGSTATVAVTVSCVDDPPAAVDDTETVTEDSGATAIDVLANDTDVDGGPKTIASVTQPANGTVVITGGGSGLTYTPDAELLQRRQPDRQLHLHAERRLDRNRRGHRHLRRRPAGGGERRERRWCEDSGATAIDVLANDTDIDGGPKAIAVGDAAGPRHGGDHRRRHRGSPTPRTPNYCNDGSPTDSFTYTLNGGSIRQP